MFPCVGNMFSTVLVLLALTVIKMPCKFSLSLSLSLPPYLSLQNHLLQSELNLSKYDRVLLYWRTRCLPPTAAGGVLSIMGLLQVVDVAYYLQYYSLPVLTALLTPIVKIILSLKAVYFPR